MKQFKTITIAHSPDSDDAFMFYALAKNKIETGKLTFTHVLKDIETLNREAMAGEGKYDVTAVSIHAYAYLADRYALLPHGASIGDQYGPMIVAKEKRSPADLRGKTIAVPGEMTTAFLVLRLFDPSIRTQVVAFDKIMDEVIAGTYIAGLIIHEGQLLYSKMGLHKIIDFGEWWFNKTNGLPLPLGGNVIRRSLGKELISEVSKYLKQSIQYSLAHRQEAIEYAMTFARDMDPTLADRFIGMYVNDATLDYGERGRKAVQYLLDEGYQKGIITKKVEIEFVN